MEIRFMFLFHFLILVLTFYTHRSNPSEPSPLRINHDELLKTSGFNPTLETIIFFHGFLESSNTTDGVNIKNGNEKTFFTLSIEYNKAIKFFSLLAEARRLQRNSSERKTLGGRPLVYKFCSKLRGHWEICSTACGLFGR